MDPILSVTELECWKPWVVLFYQLMRKVGDKLQSLHRSSCHTVRQSYTIIFFRQIGEQSVWIILCCLGTSLGHMNSMHQSLGAQLMLIPRGISWLFESSRVNLQWRQFLMIILEPFMIQAGISSALLLKQLCSSQGRLNDDWKQVYF